MGVHFEVQDEQEVMQVRSRELQLENTEKLDNLIPIVETINDVDLNTIESNTNDIKNIVVQNLDEQPDLNDIVESINKINKDFSTVKGQITKLSNKFDKIIDLLNEVNSND